MYEWLKQEILSIKTPRFHLVEGPKAGILEVFEALRPSLPSSYQKLVLEFGGVKLYRNARTNSYRIIVFPVPFKETLSSGIFIYHVGFHDGAKVYIKLDQMIGRCPIFECEAGIEQEVANDFEEWLVRSCVSIRRKYTNEKWQYILRGPTPFSSAEEEIIEARRMIKWRVLGIDPDGNHIFEVENCGSRILPAITIGARSKNHRLNGAIQLDISRIGPGQRAVLHAACYKTLVPPVEIELFRLPDPRPEDREYYYELQNSNRTGEP